MSGDDLLTSAEAAEILGIATASIKNLVVKLRLRPVVGGTIPTWRFTREQVERRKAERDARIPLRRPKWSNPGERR